ncbi:ATP-binding protein [Synechococcus sp. PCC 7336]|uniref:ATP-binding protein n=1 Tax=Synechococcus sp. PCC 7336 TaxID=195250 RepID=UPI00034D2D93|nr:ATP-binding protein [Synechococcus sp. PCC 7336]
MTTLLAPRTLPAANTRGLEQALDYLARVIQWRIEATFHRNGTAPPPMPHPSNAWLEGDTPLAQFIRQQELDNFAQIALFIALAPHLQPDFFDRTITAQLPQAGDYPQIGGWRGKSHRGFLPTGETVLFILAGDDFGDRLRLQQLLGSDSRLARDRILYLDLPAEGEPLMSGKLAIAPDYIDLFTQGQFSQPQFSTRFPARHITTEMDWDDLVLNAQTLQQIRDLEAWIAHSPTLLHEWGMKKTLKLGYRALFYGPPGTGKTLTASLLGKYTGKEVYLVDLSMVVSKYIGETETNLSNLFARAEGRDWILFFDEADALFGKRTNVRDAHDKYANQEVSYLLQRVENYDGLVILASNFKSNIDEAFVRRFQSIIHFPMPSLKERSQLWGQGFPKQVELDETVDLQTLSTQYELTGADITNVVQYCCLKALQRGGKAVIQQNDITQAIKREFSKVGKIV